MRGVGPFPWTAGEADAVRAVLEQAEREQSGSLNQGAIEHVRVHEQAGERSYVLVDRPPNAGVTTVGLEGCERMLRQRSQHRWAALSEAGSAGHNEDAWMAQADTFAVVDGTAGSHSGQLTAHQALVALEAPGSPVERIRRAEQALRGNLEPRCAGSAAYAAIVQLDAGVAHIAHVGFARVYRCRGGQLEQLTRDHSLLNAITFAQPGDPFHGRSLEPADRARFRSVLTSMLSTGAGRDGELPPATIDTARVHAAPGDVFLLATSGVAGDASLSNAAIAQLLASAPSPKAAAVELVRAARATTCFRDRTVVVVAVPDHAKPR